MRCVTIRISRSGGLLRYGRLWGLGFGCRAKAKPKQSKNAKRLLADCNIIIDLEPKRGMGFAHGMEMKMKAMDVYRTK